MARTSVTQYWPGLGINYNYNGTGSSAESDLQLLFDYGFRKVRLLVVTYTDSSNITAWRSIVQTALNIGFLEVQYGLTSGAIDITSSNYIDFFDTLEAEAEWAQGINNPRLTFVMGNEESLHVDGTTMTNHQINALLVTESAAIKAIYTVGNLTLAVANDGTVSDFYDNLGSLDQIGINQYDTYGTFNYVLGVWQTNFGNKVFISEWNSNYGYDDFDDEDDYQTNLVSRFNSLKANGYGYDQPAFLYNFMNSDNTKFGMKQTTGSFRKVWGSLVGRRAVSSRTSVPTRTSVSRTAV